MRYFLLIYVLHFIYNISIYCHIAFDKSLHHSHCIPNPQLSYFLLSLFTAITHTLKTATPPCYHAPDMPCHTHKTWVCWWIWTIQAVRYMAADWCYDIDHSCSVIGWRSRQFPAYSVNCTFLHWEQWKLPCMWLMKQPPNDVNSHTLSCPRIIYLKGEYV